MTGWTGIDPTKWADNSDKRLTALLRNSVQAFAAEVSKTIPNGGRVPVKTGNLARSLVVDNKPPVQTEEAATGGYSLGIANIKPGEKIYVGFTAKYAARMNYGYVGTDSLGRYYGSAQAVITSGYSNRAGYGFVEAAVSKWPSLVAAEAAKIAGK
ncbi:MAG: hypothetical protein ABW128_15480 [Rhizorhabdus sp.]